MIIQLLPPPGKWIRDSVIRSDPGDGESFIDMSFTIEKTDVKLPAKAVLEVGLGVGADC